METELQLTETTPERQLLKLESLLQDEQKLADIHARCQGGASIGTISGVLGIPDKIFRDWVYRGRAEWNKYDPDFVKTPYMQLWEILSSAWADARTIAEAMFQKCNPEKFLQSKTSALIGDDWVDKNDSEDEKVQKTQLNVGTELLSSLKLLRNQGYDLNQIIDQDKMTLIVDAPKEKPEDYLRSAGLIEEKKEYLPGALQEVVDTMSSNLLSEK